MIYDTGHTNSVGMCMVIRHSTWYRFFSPLTTSNTHFLAFANMVNECWTLATYHTPAKGRQNVSWHNNGPEVTMNLSLHLVTRDPFWLADSFAVLFRESLAAWREMQKEKTGCFWKLSVLQTSKNLSWFATPQQRRVEEYQRVYFSTVRIVPDSNSCKVPIFLQAPAD